MQPPERAEAAPDLIPEQPVPAATTTAPPSDTLDDAEFLSTQRESGDGDAFRLALLLNAGQPHLA